MTPSDAVAPNPVESGRRVLAAEASALNALSESLGEPFARAVETVAGVRGRLVCTGVGKSGHVARKVASTLASTGTPALFVHAGEASHGDLGMIGEGDGVLALSKGGESRELADVVAHCKRFGLPLIAITAAPESALGRAADAVLAIAPEEAAEGLDAPTTSTTLQIALGDALAVALLERRGFTARDFGLLHPGGLLGAALKNVGALMHGGAELPLVSPETPMPNALIVMTEKRFGCVGVVEANGKLVGMVTDGDLRRHMGGLMERTAGEVMTRGPRTLGPDALAAEALKLMNQGRPPFTVLFVVEADRPVGVLHIHDLLRAGVV